jgi:hypothetical protein
VKIPKAILDGSKKRVVTEEGTVFIADKDGNFSVTHDEPEAKRVAPWKDERGNLKAMAMQVYEDLGPDRTEKLVSLLMDMLAKTKKQGEVD